MTVSVAELDTMPEPRVSEMLGSCCGSTRWVSTMVRRRPFGSREEILSAADEIWRSLDPSDWLEAFAHHPRIGEETSAIPQNARGSSWSSGEQAEIDRSTDAVRGMLAEANREYERRFGYIYIVCATGKTAAEMLGIVRDRLQNEPDAELAVAAEEQRKITRLRLVKLLGDAEAA